MTTRRQHALKKPWEGEPLTNVGASQDLLDLAYNVVVFQVLIFFSIFTRLILKADRLSQSCSLSGITRFDVHIHLLPS